MRHRIYNILITTLFCSLLTSCIKDYTFGSGGYGNATIKMTEESNRVIFTSDIDEYYITGHYQEKGFVITRIVRGKEYCDTISVPVDAEMKCTVTENLWIGLYCRAYAYIKEADCMYKGKVETFRISQNSIPAEVSRVTFVPDDETGFTGKVILDGKNFSELAYKKLESITMTKGKTEFTEESCTSTQCVFNYKCYNIGDFPLRFTCMGMSQNFEAPLSIHSATLDLGRDKFAHCYPYEVKASFLGNEIEQLYGTLDGNKIQTETTYTENHNKAFSFYGTGGMDHIASIYFKYNGENVYFPDQTITLTSEWTKVGTLTLPRDKISGSILYAKGRIWWQDKNQVFAMNPKTGNVKTYTEEYDADIWSLETKDFHKPVLDKGDIYVVHNYMTYYSAYIGKMYIKLMKYDEVRDEFVEEKIIPTPSKSAGPPMQGGAFVHKEGKKLYFWKEYPGYSIYNMETNTFSEYSVSFLVPRFIGADNGYVYFDDQGYLEYTLLRSPLDKINQKEAQSIPSEIWEYEDHWFGPTTNFVNDGKLYQNSAMRTVSLPEYTDYKYYGKPYYDSYASFRLVPCGNEMYCVDAAKNLYKYARKDYLH